MNKTRQHFVKIFILAFMSLMLLACASMYATTPEVTLIPGGATPAPDMIASPNPASAYAQATIDSGQNQLLDLSRQATQISLNMFQAANAAAQSTQDYNQRQKQALDFQETAINQNISRAAATQEFLTLQTKTARDAAIAALRSTQNSSAAAAQSAYLIIGSQTAQAQLVLNIRGSQTAQAMAAFTAVPLTATPYAATQAALLMSEYGREQRSFVKQIVNPMIPIIAVLDLLLFILGIVLIFRRFVSTPRPARLRIAPVIVNPNPLTIIDGGFADRDPWLDRIIPSELSPGDLPDLPVENTVYVKIVDANELPIADWITEVEHQLETEGNL
jgi:hypothetical protein